MQSHYPFAFEREMGCTADELRSWLPGACGGRAIAWRAQAAEVAIDGGRALIEWASLEPRRIALISLPRLRVRFTAQGLQAEAWQRFMRRFDLYTQRGGG
jgi:hypothetical protein